MEVKHSDDDDDDEDEDEDDDDDDDDDHHHADADDDVYDLRFADSQECQTDFDDKSNADASAEFLTGTALRT